MELSLCMIVKNEEDHLAACLESVLAAADEIIIVDTGSCDATKEIAAKYTDKVFDFAWRDDFAAARNEAFDHAGKPFMMWLDADDRMDEAALEALISLKSRLTDEVDAVMMPYQCGFRKDGTPSLVFERERIIRRASGMRFSGIVHEAIPVSGHVIHADIPVRHTGGDRAGKPGRNLAIYEKGMEKGYAMSPRDWYYYARELMDCGHTQRAEAAFEAFLGMDGWLPNRIDAHIQRGRCLDRLGRRMEARVQYLAAMAYETPAGETLCALGNSFLESGDTAAAAFWYRSALGGEMPISGGAFVNPDAYGYLPAIQLCVCYDRMGRRELAVKMNELALSYHPDDADALANRAYFAQQSE